MSVCNADITRKLSNIFALKLCPLKDYKAKMQISSNECIECIQNSMQNFNLHFVAMWIQVLLNIGNVICKRVLHVTCAYDISNDLGVNGGYFIWCRVCHGHIAFINIYPTGVIWACQVNRLISLNGVARRSTFYDACITMYNKSH